MQESKIFPKKVYAIKRGDILTRFMMQAIIQRRFQATGGVTNADGN